MRKTKDDISTGFKIAVLDDEIGIIDSISVVLKRIGYSYIGFTDPISAIKRIKEEHFDMLILDYLMDVSHGDQVVTEIRKFDKEIYILLLTGHKDLAPPLETIRHLDIQGYCEKSDKFDQLILLIESGIKSIIQMRRIKNLNSLVNLKNEELNKTYEELKARYVDTVEVLRMAVDAKDVYTRGHSDRVSYYSIKLGIAYGLSENELELLRLGGIFHDVGKIGTADDILFKTESLNDSEYNEVKRHTLKGAHILSAVSMFNEVVPLIKCHHERIDGRGYPEGLKGDEIPFLARILSVADAFDAMTSDRLYRSKLDLESAVVQLQEAAGTQFDADIVRKFIILLEDFEQMKKEINYTYD
jgi:putative nucleotidyltransferase with HDIG domain